MGIFAKILDQFLDWPIWAKSLLIALCLGAVSTLDYYTGYYLSYSVFYVVPVCLAAWGIGKWVGVIIASLSAIIWAAIGYHTALVDFGPEVQVWNFLIRASFLSLFAFVFSELQHRMAMEEMLADTDSLTGLANKRRFKELLDQEIMRAKRYGHPTSIAYLDLDNFKITNDQFGHDAGDLVLQLVAEKMSSHVRKTDITARLGGDEFCLVLLETGYDGASRVLEKLQAEVNAEMVSHGWPVTMSVGALTYENLNTDAAQMISAADAVMYDVKKSGKNHLVHKKA